MSDIIWSAEFVPGFTDNFCSNEIIMKELSAQDIWPLLTQPRKWPTYYANAANPRFYDAKGPELEINTRFYFETFGFPVEAQCVEHIAPTAGRPGRLAWHGWSGEGASRLDVHHAWLIEDLTGGRVRILIQEKQNGAPAKALAATRPDPMINGHQAWLDGLADAARKAKCSAAG